MTKKCYSCKRAIAAEGNRCFGCGHYVCVRCADRYDHKGSGLHGKRKARVPR